MPVAMDVIDFWREVCASAAVYPQAKGRGDACDVRVMVCGAVLA